MTHTKALTLADFEWESAVVIIRERPLIRPIIDGSSASQTIRHSLRPLVIRLLKGERDRIAKELDKQGDVCAARLVRNMGDPE